MPKNPYTTQESPPRGPNPRTSATIIDLLESYDTLVTSPPAFSSPCFIASTEFSGLPSGATRACTAQYTFGFDSLRAPPTIFPPPSALTTRLASTSFHPDGSVIVK